MTLDAGVAVAAIELVAVLAFAFSGFAEAHGKRMDAVGVFTVAFVTAFGGGTLRDLLLDRRPFYWVEHYEYVLLILALTLVAPLLLRLAQRVIPAAAFIVADAVGLGFFSISGTALAAQAQLPWIVAAMLGVITGVAGGILRDVIVNEVPMVLRDGRPYALAAFVGCCVYLLLAYLGAPAGAALWSSAALIVAIRLLALWRGWRIR
ncbi:MAG: trimeric intracellular cation channel family protein [Burkholderiaceae bacterium]|nr:trimeric intracellular cation channel family protein [Burkholderiaceae bacterium]